MNYLAFLKFLLSLGPVLQDVWPDIQAAYDILVRIVGKVQGAAPDGTLSMTSVSTEEAEAETAIAATLVGNGSLAVFDGSRLRGIFTFLQSTGLLDWLVGLLAKKALGG